MLSSKWIVISFFDFLGAPLFLFPPIECQLKFCDKSLTFSSSLDAFLGDFFSVVEEEFLEEISEHFSLF
jgi:hypothetical protein